MYRSIIATLVLLVCSTQLLADERVRGKLDSVNLSANRIVVDGTEYVVNTELTRVLFKGIEVGEEGLARGDRVELVLREAENDSGPDFLVAILLLRGSRSGLDS